MRQSHILEWTESASHVRECDGPAYAAPLLSLILPTYRRPLLLAAALQSISASRGCDTEDVEVIVVDNSPDEEARAVVGRFEPWFPYALIYATEPRPGVSHARNRGAALARGRLLAFMDDDQQIDPLYLQRAPGALEATNADCIGGWLGYVDGDAFPAWMHEIAGRMGTRDLGPGVRQIGIDGPKLAGGNLIVRREAFTRVRGFRGEMMRLQDIDFQERLLAAGGTVFYDPTLRQYHYLEPQRLARRYYLYRAFRAGRCECRTRRATWIDAPRFCSIPRFIFRRLAQEVGRALAGAQPATRFHHWCEAAGQLGWIYETAVTDRHPQWQCAPPPTSSRTELPAGD
jgi:GT2 family glycosyltransferase